MSLGTGTLGTVTTGTGGGAPSAVTGPNTRRYVTGVRRYVTEHRYVGAEAPDTARLDTPVTMDVVVTVSTSSFVSTMPAGPITMNVPLTMTASGYVVAELVSDIELLFDMQSNLFVDVPVAAPPSGVESALIKRVSPTMPAPVLVDGRPS